MSLGFASNGGKGWLVLVFWCWVGFWLPSRFHVPRSAETSESSAELQPLSGSCVLCGVFIQPFGFLDAKKRCRVGLVGGW